MPPLAHRHFSSFSSPQELADDDAGAAGAAAAAAAAAAPRPANATTTNVKRKRENDQVRALLTHDLGVHYSRSLPHPALPPRATRSC